MKKNVDNLYRDLFSNPTFRKKLIDTKHSSALDIGLGSGVSASAFQTMTKIKTSGLDVEDIRWDEYKTIPNTVYDGSLFPFKDKKFDISLIFFVLHHCEDKQLLLQQANRVTSKYVVLAEELVYHPVHNICMIAYDMLVNFLIFHHFISPPRFMSEKQLSQLIKKAGMKIDATYSIKKGFVHRVIYLLQTS